MFDQQTPRNCEFQRTLNQTKFLHFLSSVRQKVNAEITKKQNKTSKKKTTTFFLPFFFFFWGKNATINYYKTDMHACTRI